MLNSSYTSVLVTLWKPNTNGFMCRSQKKGIYNSITIRAERDGRGGCVWSPAKGQIRPHIKVILCSPCPLPWEQTKGLKNTQGDQSPAGQREGERVKCSWSALPTIRIITHALTLSRALSCRLLSCIAFRSSYHSPSFFPFSQSTNTRLWWGVINGL